MIGKTISHYKILEKLGGGGIGLVYKAEDSKLERTVALKFILPHMLTDKEAKQRFVSEAKAAASLNHPNITTIHAIEELDDDSFINILIYVSTLPYCRFNSALLFVRTYEERCSS